MSSSSPELRSIRLLALTGGLLLAFAFPPSPFAFLIYFGFVPLLFILDRLPEGVKETRFWWLLRAPISLLFGYVWHILIKKEEGLIYRRKTISRTRFALRISYWSFFIWNLLTCYWLTFTALGAESFEETLTYLSAGGFAILANPLLMSIPVMLYLRVKAIFPRWLALLALGAFWITFEWLHLNWDLSWSWLTLAHSMTLYPVAFQYIEITGALGISVQILAVNFLIYLGLRILGENRGLARKYFSFAVGLIALPFLLNLLLLRPDRPVFESVGSLNVRVIQPNVDPYDKFLEATRELQIQNMADLMRAPGVDSIDLAILPETSLPGGYSREQLASAPLFQPLRQVVDSFQLNLLTGFNEYRYFDTLSDRIPASATMHPTDSSIYYDVCNSSAMLSSRQEPQSSQKGKLVPMVERMPFLETLRLFSIEDVALAGSWTGLGLPDSVRNLVIDNGEPIASLVCYESEFGDYVTGFVRGGAKLLVIITNDGWWRKTSGHIQHAHFASLRAVETRRAVARSANTGISLFADNRGAIHQATEYGVRGYEDRKLKLYDQLTFYARHGDYLAGLAALLSILLLALGIAGLWRSGRS